LQACLVSAAGHVVEGEPGWDWPVEGPTCEVVDGVKAELLADNESLWVTSS